VFAKNRLRFTGRCVDDACELPAHGPKAPARTIS
jgi:hypothetical protein